DEEIACERHLEATGDGGPVDRADDRLGDGLPRMADGEVGAGDQREVAAALSEFLQVESGAEGRVGAGEDHDVRLVVRIRGCDLGAQGIDERRAERVPRLRAVEGQDADGLALLDEQDLFGSHGQTVSVTSVDPTSLSGAGSTEVVPACVLRSTSASSRRSP